MLALLLALAPEVSRRLPPNPPDAVGPLIGGLGIVIAVVSLVWLGLRRLKGRGTEGARQSSGGGGIGNALFEMNAFFQPDRPNIETIMRMEEEGIQDEAGDGRDPDRDDPTRPSGGPRA